MPRQDLSPNDIAELRAKLNGRPIVALISGGKDSAATADSAATEAVVGCSACVFDSTET